MLTSILSDIDTNIILCAGLTTGLIFATMTIIAYKNRHRQYSLSRYLFQIMIADFIIGIIMMIFFRIDSVLIALVQAVISGFYLMIDLHLIMNNKNELMTLDDHVFASLMIYTDLIRLFIKIVEILNKLSKNDKDKN
jgi:FtsH-binding integral membrane protein